MSLLFGALLVTLVAFGVLADRALVGQGEAAREATATKADDTARGVALSVRAALAEIEQAVSAGRAPDGVRAERLALPPPRSFPSVPFTPYGKRPRAELARLLSSDAVTPSGLPEAVVVRLVLGEAPVVTGAPQPPKVEDRLLAGELPVRLDDLPELARRLGLERDPRLPALQERLKRLPPADEIPGLPAFRRTRLDETSLEGWGRSGLSTTHYVVPVSLLLSGASRVARVTTASSLRRDVSQEGPTTPPGLARVVTVPDVEGLVLVVTPVVPGALRLAALRLVLLTSVVAGVVGLVVARRAFAKEAHAVARERAFLSTVTHELRTPLAAIRLFGETLAEGRGDPRDYGALVAQESERLSDLVERVLAATRVDEAPRFAPVSPADLARSAVELIGARAQRRNVTVACHLDGELPEAQWDGDAVRRALLNLLDNAVKHGKEGGRVDVRVRRSGEDVHLVVSDDGPGIGPVHRGNVFGRFTRGSTEAPGAGLGLYLVDQVARAHGGRVDLVTEEGRGSTFTLILPVVPAGPPLRG